MFMRSTLLMTAALTLASASLMISSSAEAQPGNSAGKGKGAQQATVAHTAPGHAKSNGKGHPDHQGNGYGHGHDAEEPPVSDPEPPVSPPDTEPPVAGTENCAIYYAGQHKVVGSVCASVVGGNLVVDYIMEGNNKVSGTHLWVGDTLASAPRNGSGNPVPGQFPYHGSSTPASVYTYTIPLSQLNINADTVCGEDGSLFIAAHGSVGSDSAWAGETRFTNKGNWATYFSVKPTCGGGDNGGGSGGDTGGGNNGTCTNSESVSGQFSNSKTSVRLEQTNTTIEYFNVGGALAFQITTAKVLETLTISVEGASYTYDNVGNDFYNDDIPLASATGSVTFSVSQCDGQGGGGGGTQE